MPFSDNTQIVRGGQKAYVYYAGVMAYNVTQAIGFENGSYRPVIH